MSAIGGLSDYLRALGAGYGLAGWSVPVGADQAAGAASDEAQVRGSSGGGDSGQPSVQSSDADSGANSGAEDVVELSSAALSGANQLSPEDQARVDELRRRDQEVRQHEAAHQAAAGSYTRGGPQFKYERGPDGKLYAVSGEVQIDTSTVGGDPQATIRKMETVRAAALAPGDPSGQDQKVAAQAAAAIQQAQKALADKSTQSTSPTVDTYA
jgi:hypothetical protein